MVRGFAYFALSLALCSGVSTAAPAPTKHKHPHLHHALLELRLAHKELTESKFNFGNERFRALAAIDAAIHEIEAILKFENDYAGGTPTKRDVKLYKAYTHHPHLHHVLVELKHAHKQLKETKHNLGGHRAKALRDIEHAEHRVKILLKAASSLDRKTAARF